MSSMLTPDGSAAMGYPAGYTLTDREKWTDRVKITMGMTPGWQFSPGTNCFLVGTGSKLALEATAPLTFNADNVISQMASPEGPPGKRQGRSRPRAMMVPDYAMSGEIMVHAFGFDQAWGSGDVGAGLAKGRRSSPSEERV